ncbi:hypothetical protein PV04_05141 [Phialophora macrospora]|uniref:Major facilitator superfamily (MFS) profile domain-containing protein n=1 Tax=Phialophora macrospora TaxID=1851006 RepID=A0A0D2CVS4_9EURO|nr:hypothetical protein PV04_05141 [Phialophora macrospora]
MNDKRRSTSAAHYEESGAGRQLHRGVDGHANNTAGGSAGGSRRSSIAPTSAVAGRGQDSVVVQQEDATGRKMPAAMATLAELSADASNAAARERKMGLFEGVRLYPKAIFFSLALSMAVVMEGYDTALLSSFYGLPAFRQRFGQYAGLDQNGDPTYQLHASWQNGLSNGTSAAQIIGLFINGIVSERIGYRRTMLGALVSITCCIFVQFFAVNVQMLLAGYILSGLPWGVFQTLTTTYAAEVCPVILRPYLTTYVNLCWVMGQLIAAGILKGFATGKTEWAYRIPYAIQWIWPIPIAIVTLFAPESPWWLVRHGKLDQARATLLKLGSRNANPNFNVEDTLAMMIHTNELEMQQTAGTSYWDCFKGTDLRRTELAVMSWIIQHTSGGPMVGSGVYFMEQAGLAVSDAFSLGVGQSAMGFVGTIASWSLLPYFGRRTLYLSGLTVMLAILVVIGGLGVPELTTSIGWASGILILVFTFAYDLTIGPVCYSLVAELPSTRLRIKTVVLARNAYLASGLVTSTLQARFINPTAWNWRGQTAFFWMGTNLLSLAWTYFRLPEPKGLTYADMDVLFENRVSARKFRKVPVDPYSSNILVTVTDDGTNNDSSEKKV